MSLSKSDEQKRLSPPKDGIFYGWVIVGAAFVVMMICFGIAYTFAAFFQSLQQEFKATRADVSLIFAICSFLYFSLGAVSGPLADRVGPRWVVAAGLALIGIGLLIASQAQALWQVYLSYSLSVGVGVGLAYVPAVATVQRWFLRRRGLASGLATSGIGVGTLVAPPLASFLIGWLNWRGTYIVLAILAALLGVSAALLLEHSPQRRGLLPDGQPLQPETSPPGKTNPPAGATLKQALSSRPFWMMYAGAVAISFGLFIPFVHLAAYAKDKGLPETVGVLLIGLIGIGSTVGRFTVGSGADRFGRRNSLAAMFLGVTLMLLWWLMASELWSLAIFAVVFGLCYGGFVALIPALTADYFGGRSLSSIIGILYTSVALGSLLGPTLAGTAFDLSQSYAVAILVSAFFSLIGVGCILFSPLPRSLDVWQAPDKS